MSQSRYSVRVIGTDEVSFVPDMERIEFRTQKNAWSAQSLLECFDESYIILGLFDFEKLIGFSVIYNTSFSTDLLTIGVDPDYQGKKLGFMLLKETLRTALQNRVVECYLEVRVSNVVAINLYKKMGFEIAGIRKGYYNPVGNEPAEDAYTMSLKDVKLCCDRIM